ncbi:MAG: hypothetical protein MUF42_04130 [Cytophagaceae bacterium]|jgi:choloylglycine hydrolase|nr:hypothetical protein [Cytophagaceae bacterium]
MNTRVLFILFFLAKLTSSSLHACSIVYYIDSISGKVYALTHEDFYYSVRPYVKIESKQKNELARVWFGWKKFAQGGVNEAGLFFDVASLQGDSISSMRIRKNIGDKMLASCRTVEDAIAWFTQSGIAFDGAQFLIGDRSKHAAVIEWKKGKPTIHWLEKLYLLATNTSLQKCPGSACGCHRYAAMEKEILRLQSLNRSLSFLEVANILGHSVQPQSHDQEGRSGGTLYSCFISLSDMELICVGYYNSANKIKLDLKDEFKKKQSRKIKITGKP